MKRLAFFSVAMMTAVLLQASLFSRITLFEVGPDLILVVVVSLALLEGPVAGAVAGFGGGLLRDILLEAPLGLTALAYLTVGYLVGTGRPYVQSTSVFLPVATVGVGTVFGTGFYILLSLLFGGQPDPLDRVLRVILLTSAYNVLLTPFVYPVIRRLAAAYPNERVYRR